MSETSIGGFRYFLLFKDDKSGFRHTYFLKHKSEVIDKFKKFEQLVLNKFETRIKTVRADNGTEFCNKNKLIMINYFALRGIVLEISAPYTHEQNGRSEREMRTIVECARTMQKTYLHVYGPKL